MARLQAVPPALGQAVLLLAAVLVGGCNSPYPESDEGKSIFYSTFYDEPKHLDPARAYATDEYSMMGPILEPPFEYHFLKRPYEVTPLVTRDVPKPERRTAAFRGQPIEVIVYTVRLKPGILYQDHPCFVEANRHLTEGQVQGVRAVWDIRPTATRELAAGDFVYAIRRLADPRLVCPIFSTLAEHFVGLKEYQATLQEVLDQERAKRKAAGGVLYNQEQDEQYNPVPLDYAAGAERFPFVREVDPYTFEVVLAHPYPQILYWMAMPFFAPVPPEAVSFFNQPVLLERTIVFDKNPVGTGPYVLREFDPTNQIVLARNENFRDGRYPDLPEPDGQDPAARALWGEMKSAGLMEDAGKRLPMVDRLVLRLERESIPCWNKFLQGYYDSQGIPSDVFDQAVKLSSRGDAALTDEMASRGIRLLSSYSTTTSYLAFNMLDGVVGGYTDAKCKLRQAISIAFNSEDEISIFLNGRGLPGHSPIPPGIFGHREGREGINPVVYQWDAKRGRGVRRSVEEAKELLAEAGYPDGYGPDGQRLMIRFAVSAVTPESRAWLDFARKQFDKLKIGLDIEDSDWNRLREKIDKGNFQLTGAGWVADYPDPENFLFLLYGPNGKVASKGENAANYKNARYDELFDKMRGMENSPERLEIVAEMIGILQRDAPWVFRYHPKAFGLYHAWVKNAWPHALAFNTLKYLRLDAPARTAYRRAENQPRWWPVIGFAAVLVLASVPALRAAVRRLRES